MLVFNWNNMYEPLYLCEGIHLQKSKCISFYGFRFCCQTALADNCFDRLVYVR